MNEPTRTRWVIGCMTGTSLDGLDAALVRIEGTGLSMRAALAGLLSLPLGELSDALRALASGQAAEPVRVLRAARRLGELHADAVQQLMASSASNATIDFVVAHGQTIWHVPQENLSWQLMDPWPIVRRTGLPVCYDLRQADLIAGGQGAPITPMSDWVMFRTPDRARLIVNLGGICNVTRLPAESRGSVAGVRGGDIGPCNLLLDALVRMVDPSLSFDEDGKLASAGRAHGIVAEHALRTSSFFSRAQPRTTGREDFSQAWARGVFDAAKAAGLSGPDIVASGVQFVAELVAQAVRETAQMQSGDGSSSVAIEVVLAGGGAKNRALDKAIARACGGAADVMRSESLGVPVEAREAMAMAVLGALSDDGCPITLDAVTGAKKPGVAGAWVGR